VVDEDSVERTTAFFAVEVLSRAWARRPFKRHRLDLHFAGPVPPYLMTGHTFTAVTMQPVNSRWFRVGVLDRSTAPIYDVSVQLISVDPANIVPVVPLPLHLMHDNPAMGQPHVRTFSVQPGGDEPTQYVDVVSKIVGQQAIQIEHIVPGVSKLFAAGSYKFGLRISAPYQRSRMRAFSVGLDDQGELTFQQES